MDVHQDLIKWFRTMGYNGAIPESLIGICNNSTRFLWEDLMQNVRPKQEVELIKTNIFLNQLKAKHMNQQGSITTKDDFVYRIQEIENLQQKLALEEKLKFIKDMLQDKQYKVEKLSQNCKIKDISIEFLKKKVKENEERKYLLDLKKQQLQIQDTQTKETLNKLKNVTPVERDESSNSKEIIETLEKCAEKLNNIIKENQRSLAQNLQKNNTFLTVTKTQRKQDHLSVATYLSIQEKEDFEEITRSCVKKPEDKENIPSNIQGGFAKLESRKRLFDIPQVIVEDTEKLSFERLPLSRNLQSGEENGEATNKVDISFRKPKKRESLGLLPESCFGNIDNDTFLHCSDSNSPRKETNNISDNSNDNLFSFMSRNQMNSNDSSDSVVFNFNKNIQDMPSNKLKSVKVEESFKNGLYDDNGITNDLKKLLHCNNRELIYENLQKLLQNIKIEFTKMVSMEGSLNNRKDKVNEDDITKLHFIHLQTELKIVQQKRILKDLIAKIGRRKLQILSSFKSKTDLGDLQDSLDITIKQVALDASLAAMKKEINSSNEVENDDNEVQILSSRILKVKNEIANKIKLIHLTIEELYNTQKFLTSTRESVLSPIWHIRMFKTDTEWMSPLLENLWSEEIRLFESFPLEYQRRCTFTNSKTYYRDLCTDNYPENTKLEPEHLQMLSEILESPFSPPEMILLNILKAKMKLQVLKKLKSKNVYSVCEQYSKKYSYEELQSQESYIEFSIDKLKSIKFSSNAKKTLSIGDVIMETMKIWTEMPMKDYISNKRLVDGQNYQYYENMLYSSFL